jgi:hypothetical protein
MTQKYRDTRGYLIHKWNFSYLYRYNLELTGNSHDSDYLPSWTTPGFPIKIGQVVKTASTMLLCDGVFTADYADRSGLGFGVAERSFYGGAVHGNTRKSVMCYVDGHADVIDAYEVEYVTGSLGNVYKAKLPSDH